MPHQLRNEEFNNIIHIYDNLSGDKDLLYSIKDVVVLLQMLLQGLGGKKK